MKKYLINWVFFMVQYQIIIIKGGQHRDNSNGCEPILPCTKCEGQSNNCTQCIVGIGRKTVNPCDCEDGYFQEDQNQNCTQCNNTQCGTCSGSPTTCIILCDSTCQTCNIDGTCASCSQFQEIFQSKCQCIIGTGRSLNLPNCQCNNGYYQINQDINCGLCDNTQCGTCQGSPTTCIISCDNTCLTCNIDGTCTSCSQFQEIFQGKCQCIIGTGRSLNLPNCQCNNGYYQINQDINCGLCDNTQCGTCSGSPTTCIISCDSTCQTCNIDGTCASCSQFQEIFQGKCQCIVGTGRSLSLPNCLCNNGYYQINQDINCGLCDNTQCGTCSGSPTTCVVLCNDSCKTCNPDGSCSSCDLNKEIQGNQCQCMVGLGRNQNFPNCDCKDGFYQINSQKDCGQCDDSLCGTCKDTPFNCQIFCQPQCRLCKTDGTCKNCFQNQYLSNGSCVKYTQLECQNCFQRQIQEEACPCQIGQYLVIINEIFQCLQCQYPCQQCCSQQFCLECVNQINRQNQPICQCLQGYYNIYSENVCAKCHYKCKQCINYDTCTENECSNLTRIYINNCECKVGYYDNNQIQCLPCKYPCSQCSSQNNCIMCKQINLSNVQDNCDCIKGYYHDLHQNICQKCDNKCQLCIGNAQNCQLCSKDLFNKQFLIESKRINLVKKNCSYQKGFYEIPNNLICQKCQYPCKQCSGHFICIPNKCFNKQFRQADCKCKQGYFDNGEFCEQKK